MRFMIMVVAAILFQMSSAGEAGAQHLWWDAKNMKDATCLYGEITVLATHHAIYYCGANWHPGEPAGGYCGIQHNGPEERRTIFSIWDTSPELHPEVTEADPKTIHARFGGEGEGSHTHMLWDWQAGDTVRFFLRKQPGREDGTTDTRYYVYDRGAGEWIHSATITSPNGDVKSAASVSTIGGGGLVSFLENFEGTGRDVPKLALYRLWLGDSVDDMRCLTRARGDATWGRLGDAYFLAEGDSARLGELFGKLEQQYGAPVFGGEERRPDPLPDRPLSNGLIMELKALPRAPEVRAR